MNEAIPTTHPADHHNDHEPVSKKPKTEELIDRAKNFTETAKEKGQEYLAKSNEFLDRNSTKLGEKLGSVSQAGDPLRDHIGSAQESLGNASQYLQSRNPEDMGRDLIRLGQRNPKAAAGVLLTVGFLLARKLYS